MTILLPIVNIVAAILDWLYDVALERDAEVTNARFFFQAFVAQRTPEHAKPLSLRSTKVISSDRTGTITRELGNKFHDYSNADTNGALREHDSAASQHCVYFTLNAA